MFSIPDDMKQPTAEERIENALTAASETSPSVAVTLHRIMSALGYNFGDVDDIEHGIMQHYADPTTNPFIQAQLEARIKIDVGELERVIVTDRIHVGRDTPNDRVRDLANIAYMIGQWEQSKHVDHGLLAKLFIAFLKVAINDYQPETFNEALAAENKAILEAIEERDRA